MTLDRAIHCQARRLLLMGASLVLLGMLTDLLVPAMANECLGLSSHIEGVLNGMRLLPGLLWPWLVLTDRWQCIALACAFQGAFANWVAMRVVAVLMPAPSSRWPLSASRCPALAVPSFLRKAAR